MYVDEKRMFNEKRGCEYQTRRWWNYSKESLKINSLCRNEKRHYKIKESVVDGEKIMNNKLRKLNRILIGTINKIPSSLKVYIILLSVLKLNVDTTLYIGWKCILEWI